MKTDTTIDRPRRRWRRCSRQLRSPAGSAILAPKRHGENGRLRAEVASPGRGRPRPGADRAARAKERRLPPGARSCSRFRAATAGVDVRRARPRPRLPRPCSSASAPATRAAFAALRRGLHLGLPRQPLFEPAWPAPTVVGVTCTRGRRVLLLHLGRRRPRRPHRQRHPADAAGRRRLPGRDRHREGPGARRTGADELFRPAAAHGQGAPPGQGRRVRSTVERRRPPRWPALFDDAAVWVEQSLRCLGCGACAFVCPTCACFDIQDEARPLRATRLRCWDSCGFGLFTLHTSGHNPRRAAEPALAPAAHAQVRLLPGALSRCSAASAAAAARGPARWT